MKVLTALIELNRFKVKGKQKIFPLLNVFDKQSIYSWLDMRLICLDLGLRFYTRIQLYVSVYIIVYVVISAVYFAYFFGANIEILTQDQWFSFLFEVFNLLILVLGSLAFGAKIN